MGYDIVAYKNKQDAKSHNRKPIIHVSCQYAWQPIFKKYFTENISNFNGSIRTNSKKYKFICGLKKMISDEKNIDAPPLLVGYVANSSKSNLIEEFKQLLKEIENGKITYLSIS